MTDDPFSAIHDSRITDYSETANFLTVELYGAGLM